MLLDGVSGFIEAEPWEFGGATSIEAVVRVDTLRWLGVVFDFLDGKFDNQLALATLDSSDEAISFGGSVCQMNPPPLLCLTPLPVSV